MARRTPPHASEALDQAVDVVAGGVDGERRARRRGHAEAAHQRLRAVVAGAHAHALAPEDLGHVVRVHALERERDDAAAPREVGRAVEREAVHLAQALERVADDSRACSQTASMPSRKAVDGRAEADRLGDRRRPRLELGGRLGPAALELGRRGRSCARRRGTAASPRAARGGRAARRCPSARRPCGPSRRRSRRRARRTSTGRCGAAWRRRPPPPRRRRARGAAISATGLIVPSTLETWATATSFGPRASSASSSSEQEALVVDRHVGQLGARALREQLPRHEVGVVLHLRDDDQVARAHVGAAPRVGDEVDRLGRVAGEDRSRPAWSRRTRRPSRAPPRRPPSPRRRAGRRRGGCSRGTRGSTRPSPR